MQLKFRAINDELEYKALMVRLNLAKQFCAKNIQIFSYL